MTTSGDRRARPSMADLFTLVFAIGGWRTGLSRLADNSFFWHLRTGRRILDHGIPRRDVYSFTAAGTRWVAQSWLAEVFYGVVDRVAGPFGIRLAVALTGALVAGLTYRLAFVVNGDRVRAAALTLAALGASFTLWSERPLFLGLLAFVGLLWIVEVPASFAGRRPTVAIPALMWLWANVHGTFALGFLYLALHAAGRWLDGHPPWAGPEARLVRATALAVVACLFNPYGPALLLFPVQLLGRGDVLRDVVEWRSPDFRTVQGLMLAAWLTVFVLAVARGRNRVARRDLLVTVPFVLLALWAQRNIAVAPLVGLPVVARCLAPGTARPETPGRLQRPLAVVLVALAALWAAQAAREPDFDFSRFPVAAMGFLESEHLLGHRMLTDDAWAGYAILRWWPAQKVFFDDRYDMYPKRISHDYGRITGLDDSFDQLLDRYGIDVVVWRRGGGVDVLLAREPGWRRVYRDRLADVYVRTGGG